MLAKYCAPLDTLLDALDTNRYDKQNMARKNRTAMVRTQISLVFLRHRPGLNMVAVQTQQTSSSATIPSGWVTLRVVLIYQLFFP